MSSHNRLELAKQGNLDAIAALINRNLKPKGITAEVSREGDCLEILLESEKVPSHEKLTNYLNAGIKKMGVTGVNTLQISARQIGNEIPTWSQRISLRTPQTSQETSSPVTQNSDLTEPPEVETVQTYETISQPSTFNTPERETYTSARSSKTIQNLKNKFKSLNSLEKAIVFVVLIIVGIILFLFPLLLVTVFIIGLSYFLYKDRDRIKDTYINRLIISSILNTEQSNIQKIIHKDNVIEVALRKPKDRVIISIQDYRATKQSESFLRNSEQPKLSSQRAIGSLLAVAGVLMLVGAISMDTTVSSSIGRINNLGLMQQQNQMAIFGGIILITGIVLYAMEKK